MQSITQSYRTSFREKGSKFIGILFPAASEDEFENHLTGIKSEFPDATHHCYGWRINPNDIKEFAQDDGEPGGTAGLPILNQLKSHDLVNAGCVVVRYYGGTNLGKSGLIQSYSEAAKRCLDQAAFVRLIPTRNYLISYPYTQQNRIDRLQNSFDLKILDATYREKVTLLAACRSDQSDAFWKALQQSAHLDIEAQKKEAGFVAFS